MEQSIQIEASCDTFSTRRNLKKIPMQNNKDAENSNAVVELPSIRGTRKKINPSMISETPRNKKLNLEPSLRFPSIFKKYSPFSEGMII